jgi:ribonuclease HII
MEYIIGSDEVGYGAWAGPLFVCAVAVPTNWKAPGGLDDSKKLTPAERVFLYGEHLQRLPMSIKLVENTYIDAVGVKTALLEAHAAAVLALLQDYPDAHVIIDGVLRPPGLPERTRCLPRADSIFPPVSAASIIAKVNRDFVMRQYHEQFPMYGFDTSVGYGTKKHQDALERYGPCPIHRLSYRPLQKYRTKVAPT